MGCKLTRELIITMKKINEWRKNAIEREREREIVRFFSRVIMLIRGRRMEMEGGERKMAKKMGEN